MADFGDIDFVVAAVFSAVLQGNGVPRQMIMNAFGVQMGADHHLKLSVQQLFRHLHADGMGQFWSYLSGCKTLY